MRPGFRAAISLPVAIAAPRPTLPPDGEGTSNATDAEAAESAVAASCVRRLLASAAHGLASAEVLAQAAAP